MNESRTRTRARGRYGLKGIRQFALALPDQSQRVQEIGLGFFNRLALGNRGGDWRKPWSGG